MGLPGVLFQRKRRARAGLRDVDSDLTHITYLPGAAPGAETRGWEGGGGRAGKRKMERTEVLWGEAGRSGGRRGALDTEPGAPTLSSCDPWSRLTL